jgi:indolepyruvate ferredoxin oxidoreductase
VTALDERPAERHLYTPADRYVPGARPVLLTGVQAIARMLVEQNVRDAAAGRRTASLVSGYPGSPLGGLDKLLHGLPKLKTDYGVNLIPGLNEELGATAVWGSQQVPGTQNVDGVIGVWYGKGPGVDRAGDALRHGNTYGANAKGGVLVMAGDDPGAKSSTVPCTSERTLASFGIPVLTPRTGEEVITFGMYGVALSRLSGCWVGIKVLADVADGLWTVDRDFAGVDIVLPELEWNGKPWTYEQLLMKDPRLSTVAEAQLLGPRWAAVEAFGAANPLDEITVAAKGAWLGIAATGTAYDATLQALRDLGMSPDDLDRAGIRVLRVGMPYPLGAALVREFAVGLEQILVVEEKTSFLEAQIKDVLYGVTGAPAVHGKRGADGRLLVPADGQVSADRLDGVLRGILGGRADLAPRRPGPRTQLTLSPVTRTPYFCSGCPHNRSTPLPEGSLGGGGIGCHTMVTLSERPDQQVLALTQMGGEGSQWIGQHLFTDVNHIFQNVGDGTYFHSGQLALQACVAAGVNITYKLLYNQVVAMTGAQNAEGGLSVPALTRKLHAERVSKIVVVSDEPKKHKRERGFAPGVTVRHRDEMDAVQKELREVPGVTVLIYDQQCANEARRLRKRGKQEVRTTRVIIDEATCEGCGDCGEKSNCLSVQPVETELGRKTRIDQTSCNTDYSCLLGDCPSFLTVQVATSAKKPARRSVPEAPEVMEPVLALSAGIFLAGIGGTGIVTVNQLLATAGLRSSLDTTGLSGLDQVGLSQKAGPVTSHLRVGDLGPANRVGHGTADVLLAFDALVAADPKNLAVCSSDFTIAVVSTSETPTGTQVADASTPKTDVAGQIRKIRDSVVKVFEMDALAASEALFGSTAPANLLLVGAAYQLGTFPFPAEAIEEAIELNGVAVAANVAAFRWGRVAVADPSAFSAVVSPVPLAPKVFSLGDSPLAGETRRLVGVRAQLLLDHSGPRRAAEFIAVVERAWAAERPLGHGTAYSEAVARGVAHLWAYKDEYEVARLLTRPELLEEVQLQVPGATKVQFNLHPPALRAMGMSSKLKLGAWSRPVLRATARGRVLRGTKLDPFGRAHLRVVERELIASHTALVESLSAGLSAETYATAVAAAGASELVRGFEEVKLRNVERYRETLVSLNL